MKKTLIIGLFFCVFSLSAIDYVMLSPLDTASLPQISTKDRGINAAKKAMENDWLWDNTHKQLVKSEFSTESMQLLMKILYQHTHKHMEYFSCAYWSQDTNGDSLLVSGKIYLPKGRKLRGVIISNHYTIGADYEAPSQSFSMDCIYTLKGYAVILPDYVGYGLSRDQAHPYLHWRSAARTAVDLLNLMPNLLDFYGYEYPKEVIITGYSQGGSVALGVARLLDEEHNDWRVNKLYAGAGPYDPAVIFDYSLYSNHTGIPGAVPMLVMGMIDAYDLDIQPQDVFLEPLASHYEEWINSKELTISEISYRIGTYELSDFLTPKLLNKKHPVSQLLYNALQINSNIGYDLRCPAYFLHSTSDDVVPFITSDYLRTNMPDTTQVTFDFGEYGSHMEGAIYFCRFMYHDL